MHLSHFKLAMNIIAQSHSVEVKINHVEPHGQVQKVLDSPTIHIKHCPPRVINTLMAYNFTLSMYNGMLSVDSIGMSLPAEPFDKKDE